MGTIDQESKRQVNVISDPNSIKAHKKLAQRSEMASGVKTRSKLWKNRAHGTRANANYKLSTLEEVAMMTKHSSLLQNESNKPKKFIRTEIMDAEIEQLDFRQEQRQHNQ